MHGVRSHNAHVRELNAPERQQLLHTILNTSWADEEQYFTADVNGDGQGGLLHLADNGDIETLKTCSATSPAAPGNPRFRAMGLCITTGVVEGACKHVVATRFKRGACTGRSTAPMPSWPCDVLSSATVSMTSGNAGQVYNDTHLTKLSYTRGAVYICH